MPFISHPAAELAACYSLVITSIAAICGVKCAELLDGAPSRRRAVNGAVISLAAIFAVAAILLLSHAREWGVALLAGSREPMPASVAWAFGMLGALGFVATAVLFFLYSEGRTARMRAGQALGRQLRAYRRSSGIMARLFKRRAGISAEWRALHDEAMAAGMAEIAADAYGMAAANTDGKEFPDGLMRMPPEFRSDPKFPEKSGVDGYVRSDLPRDDNLFN